MIKKRSELSQRKKISIEIIIGVNTLSPSVWQIPLMLFFGGVIIEQRKEVRVHASETSYYVECPRALYALVGFDDLKDAREYAIIGTRTEAYRWMERSEDRIAKIFERGGKHIETYIGGFPEEEYADADIEQKNGEGLSFGMMFRQSDMALRREYNYSVKFGDGSSVRTDTLENARRTAVSGTLGLYRISGQLNDNRAEIFDKNGVYIETYVSGLPEEEYNRIVEVRNDDEDKIETKNVLSFGWDSSKMR